MSPVVIELRPQAVSCVRRERTSWFQPSLFRLENRNRTGSVMGSQSSLPPAVAAAYQTVHRERDVPSNPDPTVADPEDQRSVETVGVLREHVRPGKHERGKSENCRGDHAGSD